MEVNSDWREGVMENYFMVTAFLFGLKRSSGNGEWSWLHNITHVVNVTEFYT